ncbi:hypothetical protein CH293_04210 [Rhodococcus sp. 14-2470-1b]|uniref:DUF6928 family protein n=1 Tax=Rhodococcus sp. 14-2470-1b TaxID=2023149 RepID=UPI000B9BB1BC|nr:hypothetical protein [Rhodococcus sp. 14-2470-1b]OZF56391.1 hypothetical protein CH293_04210 [Rhodococcus sp. 14-2470-1b]
MGVKVSTIWYTDAPDPASLLRETTASDHAAAAALVGRLIPDLTALATTQSPLPRSAGVGPDSIFVGCYPGTTVVCSTNLSIAKPSLIPESWVRPLASERTYFVATDPENAWGAFAYWERGTLRRSFSATPIYIYEDLGLPLVWERPFWAGERPLIYPPGVLPDPQSLPFHPQEFAEAANAEWLGFRYTGAPRGDEFDPTPIPASGFALYTPGEEPAAEAPAPVSAPTDRKFMRWLRRKSPEPQS